MTAIATSATTSAVINLQDTVSGGTIAADGNADIYIDGASNVALLGHYMASLFATVAGHVGALEAAPEQRQAFLAHPPPG